MSLSVSRAETSPSLAGIVSAVDRDLLAHRGQTSPDGMVTIVFTDVEGSTEMMERLGEQSWFELMKIHNGLVRQCASRHEGEVIQSLGDGFMIAFTSAAFALACAVALQRTFARFNDRHQAQQLQVRIGVHTGNILYADDILLGRTVVLAARITGQARGGEILISTECVEYTKRLGMWRYGEPTEVRLKGLSDAQRLHALDWSGQQTAR